MKKSKLFGTLALAGLLSLGLASCGGKKQSWNYDEAEFEDLNAVVSAATGGRIEDFTNASYEERTEILGLLEQYAVKNNLTGLVLYDNGGYVKYSDRVVFPTAVKKDADGNVVKIADTVQHEYVTGYGFGILSEGSLNGSLSASGLTYSTYYHDYEADDPKTLNYWNDKGSVVGSYTGYTFNSYFDTKLNETKDGYVYFPATATEANKIGDDYRPLPLNSNGELLANPTSATKSTKYRIYVRTEEDGFKYALSENASTYEKWNGRGVKLEDYVTSIKGLVTQSNGLARGAERLTGTGSLKGMNAYYNASAKGADTDEAKEAWENVGVKTGTDSTGSYIDFEFNQAYTPFYAMYYLNSSLNCPIPQAFLDEIGGFKILGSYNGDQSLSPVDTTLSSGVFVVEEWNVDQEFVFKRNDSLLPAVKGGANRYTIDGLHVAIIKAANTDKEAGWKEFKSGKLDSVGIPQTQVDAGQTKTNGTQQSKGNSTTKLNINTCTAEEWESLFGVNGTVAQTSKSDYWNVKPCLSDEDFLLGLSWSIDRSTYASKRGVTPSLSYFSDAYMSNPEIGESYNSTEAHKKAMDAIYGEGWETSYGYNVDTAIEYFKTATTKWLANGTYKAGDTITIEICWQAQSQVDVEGAELASYIEGCFNNPQVCDNQLTLKIENTYTAIWSDVYYKKMMVGQYDIGFGSISGNTLNPLNFLEVLKSDNSSGFTLNFGPNTNEDAGIEYKGKKYTFDALWQAADQGAVVTSDGKSAKLYDAALISNKKNDSDASRTVQIKVALTDIENIAKVEIEGIVCCWYAGEEYDEQEVEFTLSNGVITINISEELAEKYQGDVGFDIYLSVQIGDASPTEAYISLYGYFPEYK